MILFPGRPNNVCNLTNSSEAKNGNKEMTNDTKSDPNLLEVRTASVFAGNASVDTRRNEVNLSNESKSNVDSTIVIPLTGTTSMTWEIKPTTPGTNTTNAADNSTIQMRANGNSTGTQSGTVPVVVVAGSNSAAVTNATEVSYSTTKR